MAIELVTGYAGSGHISAADVAGLNLGVVNDKVVILDTKQWLLPRRGIISGGTYAVLGAGDVVCEGRHFTVATDDTAIVALPSLSDTDIRYTICVKYTRNLSNGQESGSLVAFRGTATTDPDIPEGSIEGGDAEVYFPIMSVYANLTNVTRYRLLCPVGTRTKKLRSNIVVETYQYTNTSRTLLPHSKNNLYSKVHAKTGYELIAHFAKTDAQEPVGLHVDSRCEGSSVSVFICNDTDESISATAANQSGSLVLTYLKIDDWDLRQPDSDGYLPT